MPIFRQLSRAAVLVSLSLACGNAAHASDSSSPVAQECIDGLASPEIHPGWTVERRTEACKNAGTACVLTVARLRKVEFNEILVNEECLYDDANCVGKLAEDFAQHGFSWGRGDLRGFCADDDLACVSQTKTDHPDWTNLDIHDHCLRVAGQTGSTSGNAVYGYAEGSRVALNILDLVNHMTESYLTSSAVGISYDAAHLIATHQGPFQSLHEIAALPVGEADFRLLAAW